MTDQARVVSVGTPQMFRHQVARALERDPDTVEWVTSVTAAEELMAAGGDPVDVLVLSPEVKDVDASGFAAYVAAHSPTSAVVLVRDKGWEGDVMAMVRAGVRDVVDLTEGTDELARALERALDWSAAIRAAREEQTSTRGTVIAVFSSKGGTGKTFLTTNLATAIADIAEQDTAVVDLDLDMGDVFSYFGDEPKNRIQDLIALGDVVDRDTIVGAATKLGEHLYGFGAPPDPAAEQVAGGAIGKFLRAVRGVFPFVVVDATAEYSDLALATFDIADAICLITGLDVVGVRHMAKALETLGQIGVPKEKFHLVLNRAGSKVGLEAEDVERVLKVKVDVLIPSSVLVPTSLNKGVPAYLEDPRSDVAIALRALARQFVEAAGYEIEGTDVPAGAAGKRKRGLFGR